MSQPVLKIVRESVLEVCSIIDPKFRQVSDSTISGGPSTVKEIRFFTSIQKGFRFPPFMVFMGTILYWGLV